MVEFFSVRVLFIQKPAIHLLPLTASVAVQQEGGFLLCTLSALCIGVLRGRQHHSDKSLGSCVPAFIDILARNAAEKWVGYEPPTADDCRR